MAHKRIRKPGDQAPPPRPTHRNPGATASTHVKDTRGKTYRVHDGSGETIVSNGRVFTGLSYDDARRAKDIAVTQLKEKRASIQEETSAVESKSTDEQHQRKDPQLEDVRQKALAAAKKSADEAQRRHEALRTTKPKAPTIVIPKVELDPIDDLEEGDGDLDGLDVNALLSGDQDEDIAHAKAQAKADIAELEAAGKALYERVLSFSGAADWAELDEKDRAEFRWRAANEVPA